ncbi:MAG TPA: long-chain-fatty-acid--CoA ligase [Blastocatellia bacterium]|nr:long-chain-fatty-acid--CoA ligase [Blastocatellia bacterium]
MNICEGLRQAAHSRPEKLAAICGPTRLTFRETAARIARLSNALAQLGVTRGDRVAVLALNCHRFFELYYAVPQMGAVIVPINFRIPPAEVKYILDHSGARALAVDEALAPLVEQIRPQLETVEHFISISDTPDEGYLSYEALLAAAAPEYTAPPTAGDELLGLFYTSGTTGEPKGVMLTHANVIANVRHIEASAEYSPDEIYLHSAPMFHLADGAATFSNGNRGSTQVFIPRFEPVATLAAIERERVSHALLVPTMINFVLQVPALSDYDLSSLRYVTYGASPIAPEVLRRAMQAFGCDFGQGYGLTEAAPLLTVLSAADHRRAIEGDEHLLASCGRAVPGVEVRVVDVDGRDVEPGEVGEIIARGPNIMRGYWRRDDDTANTIIDGWLHTGDLAIIDEEGYLYLVDRKKDMIVTGGENVFSTEVEAALYAHPAVKEAAVIAIPDAQWGEAVHACVALKDNQSVSADELIDFCRPRLATYKVPRSVEIIAGELPKGGTGKILKKQLRERHWQGSNRRVG